MTSCLRFATTYLPVFLLLLTSSCAARKSAQPAMVEAHETTVVPDTFLLPEIPATITQPDDRAFYLVMHYWNRFDFGNSQLINRPEITEQAFVDYINILNYVPLDQASQSLAYTLNKAEANDDMYKHFAALFDKYLYDPNSPFRNEELYIPVLEKITSSSKLPDAEKSRYIFQLQMSRKNRVGQKAEDFAYTLASGSVSRLSSTKSQYIILMFSDPECSTCRAVIDLMLQSETLKSVMAMNTRERTMLAIIDIYPENDADQWLLHQNQMPANWVNAYDAGLEIKRKMLYDIRAYPTLYLLDKNKRVILKDTSLEMIETFFTRSI